MVEDEAAASHGPCLGQQPTIQPIVCFARAPGSDPAPTRAGTSARGPGYCEMSRRRGASRGEATAARPRGKGEGDVSGAALRAGVPAAPQGWVPLAAEVRGSWVRRTSGVPCMDRERASAVHAQPCVSRPGQTHQHPAPGTDCAAKTLHGCLWGFHLVGLNPSPSVHVTGIKILPCADTSLLWELPPE